MRRKYENINFHLTQMLTGHECFSHYFWNFKKLKDLKYITCEAIIDNVEHTIFRRDQWWTQRKTLEVKLGINFEPDTVIRCMLQKKSNWDAVKEYIKTVMPYKENKERARQRREYCYCIN